jgi:hypothetical protein
MSTIISRCFSLHPVSAPCLSTFLISYLAFFISHSELPAYRQAGAIRTWHSHLRFTASPRLSFSSLDLPVTSSPHHSSTPSLHYSILSSPFFPRQGLPDVRGDGWTTLNKDPPSFHLRGAVSDQERSSGATVHILADGHVNLPIGQMIVRQL